MPLGLGEGARLSTARRSLRRCATRCACALVALVLWPHQPARADSTSKSYADWTISGSTAQLRISFAPHDFPASMPNIDKNRDTKLGADELELAKAQIGKKVIDATDLSAGLSSSDPKSPCSGGAPKVIGVGDPLQEVQVQAEFLCPTRIGSISLTTRYLPELVPPHVSVATIAQGDVVAQHVFTRESPQFSLELAPASLAMELRDQLVRGLRATFTPALLVFFVVLLGVLSHRSAIFTFLAFSGGALFAVLALGSLAWKTAGWIAYAVALSVAWAGAEMLFRGSRSDKNAVTLRTVIAGCCGVAHGLAAASLLAASAPALIRVTFAFGALLLLAGAFLVVRALAALLGQKRREQSARPIGIASLAVSVALLVLAFVR